MRFLFPILLAALWSPLLWHLGKLWYAFDAYRFGFFVPVLALILLIDHWMLAVSEGISPHTLAPREAAMGRPVIRFGLGMLILAPALLLLPVRILHEANPLWRLTTLAFSLLVITLTLCSIYLVGGRRSTRLCAFPVLFFLVGVPWPSGIETPMIQTLAGSTAAASVEILNLLGIPAVRHGNVIEIATGLVGVDDACSGVRSFQATVMLSFFLGGHFRLRAWPQVITLFAGFGLSLVFNILRTVLLCLMGAREGIASISKWHDPAGVLILLACFGSLYLIVLLFHPAKYERRVRELLKGDFVDEKSETTLANAVNEGPSPEQQESHAALTNPGPPAGLQRSQGGLKAAAPVFSVLLALLVWIGLVELATEAWYRVRETAATGALNWTVQWPTNNQGFKLEPLSSRAQTMMRCDTGVRATWTGPDGTKWLVNYLRWEPGQTAVYLGQTHWPEACLPATGWSLTPLPGLRRLGPVNPPLFFRAYRIGGDSRQPGYVFYCRADGRTSNELYADEGAFGWRERLRAVWKGRPKEGMTVLEAALWGPGNEDEAQQLVDRELKGIVVTR